MGRVTDKPSWRSLHVTASDAVRRMGDTPFGRLARLHAVLVAGDALVAIALAGSLFFSIDPGAARWRVAFYLLFTMAPFALVAPLVGPAIDRAKGGRRNMVILSAGLRALVAFMMVGDLDSLLLCPEAKLDDYVLVHAGYAIGTFDEEEASKTLALFDELLVREEVGPR